MNTCKKCGQEGSGYKCDVCGEEADHHDANHKCGADHCLLKCSGCNEAETNCVC